jgi:hypothetical protein
VGTNQLRSAVHPRRNVERIAPTMAKRLRFTVNATTAAEPCLDELEVYTAEASPRNIALAGVGTAAKASSVYPNSDIHRLEHVNDGQYGNGRSWISNERGKGWVELEFAETVVIDRIIWGRDREEKFSDRLPTDYRIEVATNGENWRVMASSLDRGLTRWQNTEARVSTNALEAEESRKLQDLIATRGELETRVKELSGNRWFMLALSQRCPIPRVSIAATRCKSARSLNPERLPKLERAQSCPREPEAGRRRCFDGRPTPPPDAGGVDRRPGKSVDRPRDGKPHLAIPLWRGIGQHAQRFWTEWREANSSGVARLAGDGVRRARLEPQTHSPADPDLRHLPAIERLAQRCAGH